MSTRAIEPPPTLDSGADIAQPTTIEPASGREWRDLLVVAGILGGALALQGSHTLLRVPLGVLAVLFVPGYALAAVVFPTNRQIDLVERIGLALGASLGLAALQALVLDRVLGGLWASSIQTMVSATCAVLLLGAVVRRATAPGAVRIWAAGSGRRRPTSRAARFTQAIVVANVLVAALAYGLTVGDRQSSPTEFYVLGAEDLLANYPRQVAVGTAVTMRVGVHQGSDAGSSYTITVRREGAVLASFGPLDLAPDGRWESELRFVPNEIGADQEISLVLERDGDDRPFRSLRLWLNVVPRGAA